MARRAGTSVAQYAHAGATSDGILGVTIAVARPDLHGYEVLLNEADVALYPVKRQGRDR
ncbi:GGDEF domain-containing protein [Mycetohabitans sp. B8]|uniref:GGDEF domain-containing protein n=1 Tax=Mycetohabitans sp. B8 TaxID=2841845 RepID=UPI001F48C50A|nr:GGDEF domain-containing protein [Mycetohabitans sp. B8]MCG1042764.1 GGDEF domain-containing protein [Mycetohabitans sp. B8]